MKIECKTVPEAGDTVVLELNTGDLIGIAECRPDLGRGLFRLRVLRDTRQYAEYESGNLIPAVWNSRWVRLRDYDGAD